MTEDKTSKDEKKKPDDSSAKRTVVVDPAEKGASGAELDHECATRIAPDLSRATDEDRTRLVDSKQQETDVSGGDEHTELVDDARTEIIGSGRESTKRGADEHADRTQRLEDIDESGRDPDRTEVCGDGGGLEETELTSAPTGSSGATGQTTQARAEAAVSSLTVGSVLRGRFRITGVLGEGGMGAVYSAVDMLKEEARDENVNVALKVMKPDIVDAELSFMGLQREARRAQQLAHPNIVTVYDFDRADGVIYMTMEFMRGKPLDAVLDEKPHGLDLVDARDITTQVCKGLAYAHKEGIVHSDLKPQNVFLLESGRAKILDFGIARAYRAKKVDMVERVFAGYSPSFASPEVIARKDPTPADDIFALGLLVYQLFTGRHPFDYTAADKALEQGLKPKRDASFKRAEWSAIQAALSFDRDKRPQDASEFLKRFAPSKVRRFGLGVSALSILIAASWVYFYQPTVGPDVPFEELSISLQQEITRNLADAELFLGYGDIDSAFHLYDTVLLAHPGNLEAVEGMQQASQTAVENLRSAVQEGRINPEAARQSLEALLAYETLPSRSRRILREAQDDF